MVDGLTLKTREQKKHWGNLKKQAKKERSTSGKAIEGSNLIGDAVNSIVDILTSVSDLTKDEKFRQILAIIHKTNINFMIWIEKAKAIPRNPLLNQNSNPPRGIKDQSSPMADGSTENKRKSRLRQITNDMKVKVRILKPPRTGRGSNSPQLESSSVETPEDNALEETGSLDNPMTPQGHTPTDGTLGPLTSKSDQVSVALKPKRPPIRRKPPHLTSSPIVNA
ncbi:hypothetical protein LI328DRAFT_159973 [Trichoderma asperelloides]|nr:hypothetical protein LI328DRAFT_159973 [Trichoderma asperelloides]